MYKSAVALMPKIVKKTPEKRGPKPDLLKIDGDGLPPGRRGAEFEECGSAGFRSHISEAKCEAPGFILTVLVAWLSLGPRSDLSGYSRVCVWGLAARVNLCP